MNSSDIKKFTLTSSVTLYAASLVFPAYCTIYECAEHLGFILLFAGSASVLNGGAGLLWLANPIIFYSWAKIKNEKESLILSGVAAILCLSFLFFDKVPNPSSLGHFLDPTSTAKLEITKIKPGYIFWAASAVVMFIGNCLRYTFSKKENSRIQL